MNRNPQQDVLSLAGLGLIYFIFWAPVINVLPGISTGDMGRDLYAFQMTLQNKWPCRDYFWQYGPLMPLYYASWFLIGGTNLVSIRIGLGVIYFLSSVCTYQTLRLFTSPSIAFLSSLAFLHFDMTWTFNHIGAIPFLLLSIFFLWKFFLTQEVKWCYWALFCSVSTALIKINVGLTSFSAFYASLLCFLGWIQWRFQRSLLSVKHLLWIPIIFGVATFGTYLFLYWGLSLHRLHQCLTILPGYGGGKYSPWLSLKHLVLRFLLWERSRLLIVGIFLVLGALARLSLKRRGWTMKEKETYPFLGISLLLFGVFNSIDYLMQGDFIHRFDFWIFPVMVLLIGLLAEQGIHLLGRGGRVILCPFIFLILLWFPFLHVREALAFKAPERYLDFPQGQVYLGGSLADVKVIQEVTRFIWDHTGPNEEILVIPYDSLYCFLSDRRNAIRETMLLQHNNIQESQEEEIIGKIRTKQPPFVLISNLSRSIEPEIGRFGETYCQKLAQYLFEHYREIRTFGPWEEAWHRHAIKVLQRE